MTQVARTAMMVELDTLMDPAEWRLPIEVAERNREELHRALERMLLIRRVEEVIADAVRDGTIRCPCHLAIGQEACAVGVAMALRPGDRAFGAHRSHGHFLALGGLPGGLLAEVLGRDSGVSHGMGGSMHLKDHEHGLVGTVPIVGATIPMAVGAALASRLDRDGSVAVSFFGDGATEEGGFHESLNLASTMGVPVLFVCENNLFSSHLHIGLRQPATSTSRFAEAHRIPWQVVDGNDVVAVANTARALVSAMREQPSPAYLELVTYRWRGHVGWRDDEDVGVARKENLQGWRRRDPIERLVLGMRTAGMLADGELEAMRKRVAEQTCDAWERALAAPFPAASALMARVYPLVGGYRA